MRPRRSQRESRRLWARRLPSIRAARADGASYAEIAKRYGVTRGAIFQLCKAHGIPSPRFGARREKAVPIDAERARELTMAKQAFWMQHGVAEAVRPTPKDLTRRSA